MYRNIHFNNYNSTMTVWTWNNEGERVTNEYTFKPYFYLESNEESEIKTIYGTNARKLEFINTWERNKYISTSGIKRIFYNLRPEQQFIIDTYGHINTDPEFSKHSLDVAFLDIEVYTCKYPITHEVTIVNAHELSDNPFCMSDDNQMTISDILQLSQDDINLLEVYDHEIEQNRLFTKSCFTQTSEFPDAQQAKYPINVITLYSTLQEKFFTWGLHQPFNNTQDNVNYYQFDNEETLLEHFIDYWTSNYPDVISGWNLFGFDLPYIINRISSLLGEDVAKRLSPVNSMYYRDDVVTVYGKSVGKWVVHGLTCLDYMDLYKKFHQGESPSYALNFVGEKELGIGKVKYNATDLSTLAITDWQTFVDYNIQDVNILVELDKKLQYMNLVRTIAYKGLTTLESSMGTISVVTGSLAQKALAQNMIIPTFTHSTNNRSYEGGYVRPPKEGLQSDIVSFDANSLYPNTIITLNISPETKMGKIAYKTDTSVTIELINGKTKTLTHKQFYELIKKSNLAVSKAKILYTQDSKGFCPQAIQDIYDERVDTKKKLHSTKLLQKRISSVISSRKKS